jgi:hypothetical protein
MPGFWAGSRLLGPSGGLVYHGRALCYRDTLWSTFRASVADWLARRLPVGDELLLVGPSAGHCLPLQQLSRFRRVLVLEPDPLARYLLRAGLGPQPHVEVEPRDSLVAPLLSGAAGLDAVLERRPRAAVLFCNVLGQLHFELSDEQQPVWHEAFRRRILPLLEGRDWASFHDRWSLDFGSAEARPEARAFSERPSDDELAEAWFGTSGPVRTVLDHGTSELFPAALPRRYFSWQITPRALHVVEALPDA